MRELNRYQGLIDAPTERAHPKRRYGDIRFVMGQTTVSAIAE
jgi:hypothetical protein